MTEETKTTENDYKSYKKELSFLDLQWVLMLFGTAVGAGIIFLPIKAGMFGILPLLIITIIVFPLAYRPHLGINRFCLSATDTNSDITQTATEKFGKINGNIITLAYLASIYPTLLLYGIALTNTLDSLIVNHLQFSKPDRLILSFLVAFITVGVMVTSEKTVLRVANLVVYPLILTLFGTSVYLIPNWSLESCNLSEINFSFKYIASVIVIIPAIVFSFNHMPAISSFATAYRLKLGDSAELHTRRLLKQATLLMTLFTMFFVFSCALSLSPLDIKTALATNVDVLTIFSEKFSGGLFSWIAKIISIAAICSSFFGHYMGAEEGVKSILYKLNFGNSDNTNKAILKIAPVILFLSVWWASYYNFPVISMIEVIVAPILATILYIFPVVAIYRLKEMHKFKSKWDIFTITIGVLTIIGFVLGYVLDT
jgi:serine transporter